MSHALSEYSNCLWLATMSMTGIGFGELYPQTPLGRLASSAAFVWGALLAALTVMAAIRTMELTNSEIRARARPRSPPLRSPLLQLTAPLHSPPRSHGVPHATACARA